MKNKNYKGTDINSNENSKWNWLFLFIFILKKIIPKKITPEIKI